MVEEIIETGGADIETMEDSLEALMEDGKNSEPHQKFLRMIFAQAINDRATDIYFELTEREFRTRCRVDNTLYEMMPPPIQMFEQAGKELKCLFGLLRKIETGKGKKQKQEFVATRDATLDEVASLETVIRGRSIRLNLTRLPTAVSENYHIEIFDWEKIPSLPYELTEIVKSSQSGLILLSSPQDNGKTTTGYQMLNSVNRPDRITLAVERKPSYAINGITRLLVNPAKDSYPQMLRAIRSYNPDAIFFDDLSDEKTASEILHYSRNGKLVIAAVTSKDCAASLEYLASLGVNTKESSRVLRGLVSQRLLKKIHAECKGRGCADCYNSGCAGRIAVYQILDKTRINELTSQGQLDTLASTTQTMFPQIFDKLAREGTISEDEAEYQREI